MIMNLSPLLLRAHTRDAVPGGFVMWRKPMFDLSHLFTNRTHRRDKLESDIQQLHTLMHPRAPIRWSDCTRCLGLQGIGWASHLATGRIHSRRSRR